MATLNLFAQLESLKKERNAIILAHYYQDPDIQDIANCIGDNLALAQLTALDNMNPEIMLSKELRVQTLAQ